MYLLSRIRWGAMSALLAAVCSLGTTANAQVAYTGKFTLPFEAHWGIAVLPAGNYTFAMESSASPYVVSVKGPGKSAILIGQAAQLMGKSGQAELTLVDLNGEYTVLTMSAPGLGYTIHYPVSKAKSVRMAQGRPSTVSVPLVAAAR